MRKYLFFMVSVSLFLALLPHFAHSQSEKNISITFSGDADSLYWVAIRDNSKRLIKFLPASEKEKGRYLAI